MDRKSGSISSDEPHFYKDIMIFPLTLSFWPALFFLPTWLYVVPCLLPFFDGLRFNNFLCEKISYFILK